MFTVLFSSADTMLEQNLIKFIYVTVKLASRE